MTHRPHIILDLDQTLISAEPEEEYNFKANKRKAKLFRFKDMHGYYIIFERPGLQPFLDYIFKHYTVSVWTAASRSYALFIIKHIILAHKEDRHLDWIFFSYHCSLSRRIEKASKKLDMLWNYYSIPGYTATNTVIIDDNEEVYNSQKDACIIAPPFEFHDKGSEHDSFLARLAKRMKRLDLSQTMSSTTVKSINASIQNTRDSVIGHA